jgi:hypothetical protein
VRRQLAREGSPLGGGWKRGEFSQAVGVSRGGRTTKIHCLADPCGRIVALALTPGNVADITMAVPMLEAFAPTMRLVADKAYDADRLRNWLVASRTGSASPPDTTDLPSTTSPPLRSLRPSPNGLGESPT